MIIRRILQMYSDGDTSAAFVVEGNLGIFLISNCHLMPCGSDVYYGTVVRYNGSHYVYSVITFDKNSLNLDGIQEVDECSICYLRERSL